MRFKRLFNESLTFKISTVLSLLIVIGLVFIAFFSSAMMKNFAFAEFKGKNVELSSMLASQMQGGIKWKKSKSIESVYYHLTHEKENSNLAEILVTDENKEVLSQYEAGHYKLYGIAKFLDSHIDKLDGKDNKIYVEATNSHLLVLVASFDKKKNQIIGYAASSWSKEQVLAEIAEFRRDFALISALFSIALVAGLVFILKKLAIKPVFWKKLELRS